MFTHLFQLWLFIIVSGLTVCAVVTWFLDRQDERTQARLFAAEVYARQVIADRALNGHYALIPSHMIQLDYEDLYNSYLERC